MVSYDESNDQGMNLWDSKKVLSKLVKEGVNGNATKVEEALKTYKQFHAEMASILYGSDVSRGVRTHLKNRNSLEEYNV